VTDDDDEDDDDVKVIGIGHLFVRQQSGIFANFLAMSEPNSKGTEVPQECCMAGIRFLSNNKKLIQAVALTPHPHPPCKLG
jgi:hypothetical protein